MESSINFKAVGLMWLLGMVGVMSVIPQIAQMAGTNPAVSVSVMQIASSIQSAFLLFGMVVLGAVMSTKAGLAAPYLYPQGANREFNVTCSSLLIAVIAGVAGGLAMFAIYHLFYPYLPANFLTLAEKFNPAWYTRLLYGGITEEILVRWGLMSFIAWLIAKVFPVSTTAAIIAAIFISAILFGIGHLPMVFTLVLNPTGILVTYIIVGNTIFGLIAGWLYWKRGLEYAMIAHISAHLTMLPLST